jgi:hypothetical protein
MRWSIIALCVALLACSHDIDALKSQMLGSGGKPASGGSGGGGDKGGTGASSAKDDAGPSNDGGKDDAGAADGGASDGGDAGTSLDARACLPCADLSADAQALKLEVCCRGYLNGECGLRSKLTGECLPTMVPGAPSVKCSASAMVGLGGCCRPDARCGLDADASGLGCVEPRQLAADNSGADAETCESTYKCKADEDCAGAKGDSVCAQQSASGDGYCVDSCQRDPDCLKGQVCSLMLDYREDRVLATCMQPGGPDQPGAACVPTTRTSCDHSLCLTKSMRCTLICTTNDDCPASLPKCVAQNVKSPSTSRTVAIPFCQ